ncbi:MAG: type IV toxin-antitoxin system AbiEi family antitoxin domain-containing protein [Gemmatimonadota bacterium]
MARELPAPLRALLLDQEGVLTRQQALAVGMTGKAVRASLESGRWQRLQLGVYAAFSGEPPRAALLWAAVLRAGPGAVLSHQTAAELYGLLPGQAPLIHVTVPSGSRVAGPPGVRVHYSGRLAQARHPVLAPPRTRLDDTVLDLAGQAATLDDAVSLILLAVGGRRTTPDRLLAAMSRRSRLSRRAELRGAAEAARRGVHSLLEYRYLMWVERPHGLPPGNRQRRVVREGRREYQDIAYDAYRTVVELDGLAAHPAQSRWRDTRRDNLNTAFGLATIRLGYLEVSGQPCASAGLVGRALAGRGWTGSLRRCGPSCGLPGDAG